MDFDDALRAHVEWKLRVAAYVRQSDGSLDPVVVARVDQCRLGQWLDDEQHPHAGSPEFIALRTQHAAFHQAAADLVRRTNAGEDASADVALGSDSPFEETSLVVRVALLTMKHDLAP